MQTHNSGERRNVLNILETSKSDTVDLITPRLFKARTSELEKKESPIIKIRIAVRGLERHHIDKLRDGCIECD